MSNYSNERKSYSLILIILLLVIAIIAAAFGGYSWWALKHAKSGTTGTSQQKVIPAPVFMSLEPFTINLIDEEEHLDRVLYIGSRYAYMMRIHVSAYMIIYPKFVVACYYFFLVNTLIKLQQMRGNNNS